MSKKIHGLSKRNWKCFFVGFVLAWILAGGCCAAFAGVPVKFTVETSRADVQEVQCYHGETLDFDVTFKNYGKDLVFPPDADAQIFWQTNGMSAFYWRTNNVNVVSNRMTATFLPEMDPGANTVFGFIGIPGDIYRASFVLRLKQSPGWKVKEMEWPYRELDFSKVEMKNVPFYFKDETDERLNEGIKDATNKLAQAVYGQMDIDREASVKKTQKINDKPLSGDISLSASDVGAMSTAETQQAIASGDQAVKTELEGEIGAVEAKIKKTTIRGRFESEVDIPVEATGYEADEKGSRTPTAADVIMIEKCEDPMQQDTTFTNTVITSGSWKFCKSEEVLIAYSGSTLKRTTDGENWSTINLAFTPSSATYGEGGKFILANSAGNIYYSTDKGLTFTMKLTVPQFESGYVIANPVGTLALAANNYNHEKIYAISSAGDLLEVGGWDQTDLFNKPSCIGYRIYIPSTRRGGLYYNAVNGSVRNLTHTGGLHEYYPSCICGNESVIICKEESSRIRFSRDKGMTWKASNLNGMSYSEKCIGFGANKFVVSTQNKLMFSKDGEHWSGENIGRTFNEVCYFKNAFYFSASDGIKKLNNKIVAGVMKYEGDWQTVGRSGWKFAYEFVDSQAREKLEKARPPEDYDQVKAAALAAAPQATTYTKTETDERIAAATPADYETVRTKANSALQPGAIETTVTRAYIREKLGVYLYVGEDGGIYVHTEE